MSQSHMVRPPLRGMAKHIRFAPGVPAPPPVAAGDYLDDDEDDDEFEADDLDDDDLEDEFADDELDDAFLTTVRTYAPARPATPPQPTREKKGFASRIRFAAEQQPEQPPQTPTEKTAAALAHHQELEERLSALEERLNRGGMASKIRLNSGGLRVFGRRPAS